MADRETILGGIFAVLLCIVRLGVSTFTPLFLDSLNPSSTVLFNVTQGFSNATYMVPNQNSTPAWQRIDPFFGIWFSMGVDTVVLGSVVIILKLSGRITERETKYPKSILIFSGSFQAVSALIYQFSTSGTRTPPYLQAELGFFYIPVAFTLRYLILHIYPSRLKLLCAVAVIVAELVSLIPIIFPGLETSSAKQEEGGATGVGRVLWPLCFAMSSIPHALWSIFLEKSVKASGQGEDCTDMNRLNMAYVMFWNFFGTFATALCLFWIDLIPGFGLMANIKLFPQQFAFNIKCIFGATHVCGFHQIFTAWGRIVFKTTMFVIAGLLLRHGEGGNLYAIVSGFSRPLLFLMFALFDEQPFRWHPHATLGTWLSLGTLGIILPAVIIYQLAPAEVHKGRNAASDGNGESHDTDNNDDISDDTVTFVDPHDDDTQPLIHAIQPSSTSVQNT